MRFSTESPNIPDELLDERDLGNVVFFCGAGVSLASGMPSFAGLAKHVVQELDVPHAAPSRTALDGLLDSQSGGLTGQPGLDQVFNLLQQEYGPEEIDHHIARRLRFTRGMSTAAHEAVLRLSRSADGKPQIVTTNFDHLFEKAGDRRLMRHAHPALPDLARGQPLHGLVYLHGRMNGRLRRGEGRHGFVVSSSDLGRAYLSEAWATRFVRDLLDRYIVVLLGYSANDPPVRYLLQGLRLRSPQGQRPIYAFDNGTDAEVQHKWRDTPVSPLAYASVDEEHSVLWNTLTAWAERADDPERWRRRIVDLATKGPRQLTPAQRGQVASVVRTNQGAHLFADADPPPCGEWLCVLDVELRYGDVIRSSSDDAPDFDPLAEYALDDDPPRAPSSFFQLQMPNSVERGADLLTGRAGTDQDGPPMRLAGESRRWTGHLSSPLLHISRWIGQAAHEPVVAWWASRYTAIHPQVLDEIERRLRRQPRDLPDAAQAGWTYLIEKFQTAPQVGHDFLLYETIKRAESEGWTGSVLRSFKRATLPYLASAPPHGVRSKPPEGDWSNLSIRDTVRFDVKFPPREPLDHQQIPEEVLPKVYRILRGHLELAAELLAEIDPVWWRTRTFYPEGSPSGHSYVDDRSRYLFLFRSILDRLIDLNPRMIRHDCALWPEEERFFFDKLRLHVWSVDGLFSGEEVASHLLEMSDDAFWEFYTRRELLMLLKARWAEFPLKRRTAIETRIANGFGRIEDDESEETLRLRSVTSACMLGWLELQGCTLTLKAKKRLEGLRRADPRWRREWDENAASSGEGVGGPVRSEPDPDALLALPLDEVVPTALKGTKESRGDLVLYRPFDGLVKSRPVRAVAALTNASRRGEYSVALWASAINCWPDGAPARRTRLFSERLARLPPKIVFELRYELFRWVERHLRRIARSDLQGALRVLDSLLDKLLANPPDATRSSAGEVTLENKVVESSRRTIDHAINSPIGCVTEGLIGVLADLSLARNAGVPNPVKSRLGRLAGLSGEGQDHAVCLITSKLSGLYDLDPDWTNTVAVPWFGLGHHLAEPAWNGLIHAGALPRHEIFKQIKSDFLNLFGHLHKWSWNHMDTEIPHKWLILGCQQHLDHPDYISFQEAKAALRATDDQGRGQCLRALTGMTEQPRLWRRFVKPFLDRAWPRELEYRTESMSRRFAEMACANMDIFPEVIDGLIPFLRPVSDVNWTLYKLTRTEGEEIVAKFPVHALKLLNALVKEDVRMLRRDLKRALETASAADPNVVASPSWKRLSVLAKQ